MGCNDKSNTTTKIVEVEVPAPAPVIIPRDDQRFQRYIIVADSIMDYTFHVNEEGEGWLTSYDNTVNLMNQENRQTHSIARGGQVLFDAVAEGVYGAVNYLGSLADTAVIIELAHNDWAVNRTRDEFYDDYITFLDGLDSSKNTTAFCVVPILADHDTTGRTNLNGDSYEDLRDTVRMVAATGKCELIETGTWFEYSDIDDVTMFPDRLHLGPEGMIRYKERLVEFLDMY